MKVHETYNPAQETQLLLMIKHYEFPFKIPATLIFKFYTHPKKKPSYKII